MACFHFFDQNCGCRGFALHHADAASLAAGCKLKPEFETSVAGAEGDDVEGTNSQAIHLLSIILAAGEPGGGVHPSGMTYSRNSGTW